MEALPLASALDNLEKSWSSLDWWLNLWTLLVVVGVVVELAVLITEYVHDWRDFERGAVHPPEKPSILIFCLGFLGAALVAIGVAGEFQIHIKAGKIETDMRDKTRQLVAIVQKQAADAKERAARLDLARVRIEKSMEWRRLSKGAKRALCTLLPPPTSDLDVKVVTFFEDPEPKQYAIEFADAVGACLTGQGKPRRGPMAALPSWPSPMKFGVWIEFAHGDSHLAKLVGAALMRSGVEVSGATAKNPQGRQIFIGPRLIPDSGDVK